MSLTRRLRGAQHHLRHRVDAELNLIPLIDILSVLVAFLLLYSAEVEVLQNSKGVQIPQSIVDVQPKQSVVVMITRDQLFVQGEPVTSTAEILAAKTQLIEPLQAVLERPMLTGDGAEGDADLTAREITVMADKSLPYAVVRKVMGTCTAASYGKISLAVMEKEKPAAAPGANRA